MSFWSFDCAYNVPLIRHSNRYSSYLIRAASFDPISVNALPASYAGFHPTPFVSAIACTATSPPSRRGGLPPKSDGDPDACPSEQRLGHGIPARCVEPSLPAMKHEPSTDGRLLGHTGDDMRHTLLADLSVNRSISSTSRTTLTWCHSPEDHCGGEAVVCFRRRPW